MVIDMIRQTPREHEIYRDLQGTLYQVMTVAVHAGSSERMVVYRNLYEPSEIFTMLLSQFMNEMYDCKNPDNKQEPASEGKKEQEELTVALTAEEEPACAEEEEAEAESADAEINPLLLKFLDARTYKDKLDRLTGMRDKTDDEMLNAIAMSLDLELLSETPEEKFEEVKNCLMMMVKYECSRLR